MASNFGCCVCFSQRAKINSSSSFTTTTYFSVSPSEQRWEEIRESRGNPHGQEEHTKLHADGNLSSGSNPEAVRVKQWSRDCTAVISEYHCRRHLLRLSFPSTIA
ncbi:hypothetical protein KOW79_018987 [Hemibagrus wyckioides]|uniref:Uncharacterized protein n=1 Tax=Hemibagrus wyckioides TaxID=337641 RepID=A0A9D3N975_9TELE|nr:hypothetical protein KOW79_018987 [Hemibagrus wyckioides]